MKVAIITQPLVNNYGGYLQNYALQKILIKMGHTPVTFDQIDWPVSRIIKLKHYLLNFSKRDPFKRFLKQNIQVTPKAKNINDFIKFEKQFQPDAYIVGSDQVWRPKYNIFLDASFLTFTDCPKKIAYAASFGTDAWEYSKEMTDKYSNYINKFKGISVREKSAIDLCKKYFNVKTSLTLDPTLLLNSHDYDSICLKNFNNKNYVFTYILDTTDLKKKYIKEFCNITKYTEAAALVDSNGQHTKRKSIEEWLSMIKNADFVICDSFHGTVFSILFHRPFIVLPNEGRGNTRIQSLLDLFNLSNRIIDIHDTKNRFEFESINWNLIDAKLLELRKMSISILNCSLQ